MATATPAERDQKKAVFVGNLPFSVEDDSVRKHFECCGEVNTHLGAVHKCNRRFEYEQDHSRPISSLRF